MDSWLRFLFGLQENEVPAGAESHVELTGLLQGAGLWIAAIIVIAAAALIVVLYRSERDLGVFQRITLGALRVLALAIVVYMLLDPRILTEIHREREAHTLVLFDTSASMSQVDEYEGAERYAMESATGLDLGGQHTRADLAKEAMKRQKLMDLLSARNRVRAYAFDESCRALESTDPAALPAPSGKETRIGDALRKSLQDSATERIAGIVLVSDGRQNAGEAAPQAASDAALREIPIHCVLVGKSRLPKNLAITDLSGPQVTEPGFPVRLEARVEASSLRGVFKVVLTRESLEGGAREIIEEREIDGKGIQVSSKLTFIDTPEAKGTYRYVVSIPVDPAEVEPDDNERDLSVRVSEEKSRVLLLAGTPTYEYRHLRNFLIRDDGLQVSCWLSSADRGYPQDGDTVIRSLPQSEDKLREYDALILLDPDPTTLTPDLVESLRRFVLEQGGGLAYVAGESYWEKVVQSPAHAKLLALLPVAPERSGSKQKVHATGWKPKLSRQGMDHPLCKFRDDPVENARAWSVLPPLFYLASAGSLRPVATSLLERGKGEIVAATQRSGAGYTVFLATDDLWRWRSNSPGTHERFWAGVVRYLAMGKRSAGSREAAIIADRDRYTLGEEVVLESSLIDGERKPVSADRLEVSVEPETDPSAPEASASKVRLNLLPVTGRPGWFSGRFRPEAEGRYVARVQSSPTTRATFSIIAASREWEDPTPEPALLEEIARRTGGAVASLGDLERIAERIPDARMSEVIGRTASTIWDSAAVLALFCGLIITEWILRKVWRLN